MKEQLLRQFEVIKANAVDVIPAEDVQAKIKTSLEKKVPLRLKIGFDPTARDIHLGHTVLLRKLRKLQDFGHKAILIIGDFTAKIGDPSGRSMLRPMLNDSEIKENAETYTSQAFKILDKKQTEVVFNSVWYNDLKVSDFLALLSSYTVARVLERDDFSKRIKENRPLTILEIVYPLVQGYDSVMCKADLEFGGTDQKFNLLVGRHLQQVYGQTGQAIVTMPLLVGLDGANKMSKSLGNYIGITEDPKSMFGKAMSVSDSVMWEYFRLLTDQDVEQLKQEHPKQAKLKLAQELVAFYHGLAAAEKEQQEFERVFSQKEIPEVMPEYKITAEKVDLTEILLANQMVQSKNEARRLIQQGGLTLFDLADQNYKKTLNEFYLEVNKDSLVLKVGKKKFLRLRI